MAPLSCALFCRKAIVEKEGQNFFLPFILLAEDTRVPFTYIPSLQVFFYGRGEFIEDVGQVTFAFFNVIWATMYLESWKRRSAELAYQWGTADQRPELLAEPRPLFKVSSASNPSQSLLHYKRLKVILSFEHRCLSSPL